MKAVQRMIMDLHFDLLKCIMILVVKSSDGARNLARVISVCSVFLNVAEDTEVLKAVCFEDLNIWWRIGTFQKTNGLLYRCAQVGNAAAQYLLAQVVLMSSSQLWVRVIMGEHLQSSSEGCSQTNLPWPKKIPKDDGSAASFMAHFGPDQASSTNNSCQTLLHSELVRKFLCQCSVLDFLGMHVFLDCYIDYFTEHGSRGNLVSHYLFNKMCDHGYRFKASVETTLEQRSIIRQTLEEALERVTERERQSNQGDLEEDGNSEASLLSTEEDWYLRSTAEVYAITAFGNDQEEDSLELFSEFEACRFSALACFDHVFT